MDSLLWYVFGVAVLTDLATGLGALPFVFVRNLSDRWQGIAAAVAGGMMISASVFSLADEALHRGRPWEVILGMLTGAAFFAWTAQRVEQNEWHIGNLSAVDSRQSVLMVATMFIHSIPEGVAIGFGYATGELQFGFLLATAIAVHNIPEGIAVTLPLRAKGVSLWACAGYAILTNLPHPSWRCPRSCWSPSSARCWSRDWGSRAAR
jgi:ZIP family zinc transporter